MNNPALSKPQTPTCLNVEFLPQVVVRGSAKTKNDDGAAVAGIRQKHLNVVTARQRSCGKVMLSLVSVILYRGRVGMPGPVSLLRVGVGVGILGGGVGIPDIPPQRVHPPVLTSSGGHQKQVVHILLECLLVVYEF